MYFLAPSRSNRVPVINPSVSTPGRPRESDIDSAMWRGSHDGDQSVASCFALETTKFFGSYHDDFVTSAHR